ncbi:hypothetical protein [Roseisalinus antarcticus]|uniref:Uncharacterized protein n=1 Tax=Roseisalinus antarcticus TaxID=254357 RepID=A0A1Y5TY60_9RHOB|nr:hypothetical protein [Roseisalinus antarcticus]SLN75617.1 hypothetical protein ROA7023_04001 [Roseisalinus antarcticus]
MPSNIRETFGNWLGGLIDSVLPKPAPVPRPVPVRPNRPRG